MLTADTSTWWDVTLSNGTLVRVRATSREQAHALVGVPLLPEGGNLVQGSSREEIQSIMRDAVHQTRQLNITLAEAERAGIFVQLSMFSTPYRVVGAMIHHGHNIRQGIGGLFPS